MKNLVFFLIFILAGTLFPACVDAEKRAADAAVRERRTAAARAKIENLQKMIVIRISEDEKFCIGLDDSVVLNAIQFSKKLAALAPSRAGTPVLIYVDEKFLTERKDLVDFVRRECARARLGKIYFDIPETL